MSVINTLRSRGLSLLGSLSRDEWIALALITLATVIFFAPIWLGGGWLPAGGGDLVSALWPYYRFASRMFRSGHLPLWNPHIHSGIPFWAAIQSGVLYPPNLFIMLFTNVPYQAVEGLVVFHFWLAGLAMYICLRLLGPDEDSRLDPTPAALGAIAWMLSDVFVTHQGNLNLIAVPVWLPLVFLGTWRAMHDMSWRWAALVAVAFALGTLAGFPQLSYMTVLLIGGAGLWWFVVYLRRSPRMALKVVGLLVLIGVVGVGLSAGAWLPTLEMAGYTERAEYGYESATEYSLPPKALIGLIAPGVYGRGPANFIGDWDRVEVGYMGALTLVIALAGLLVEARKRQGLAIFLTIIAVLSLLLALGHYFPLHRLAYDFVPGFGKFRVPARFVLVFNFGGAILAAFGLQAVRWRYVRWAAAVLVAAELIVSGMGTEVQYDDPRVGYMNDDALAWFAENPGAPAAPYRIDNTSERWQPNSADLHGGTLYDIYGLFNPLSLAHYDAFYWSVGARGTPLYNFLGAKYVIATSGHPPGDATFVPVYDTDNGLTIYLNLGALPLAHLVYEAVPIRSAEEGWNLVHRNDWDPTAIVYVENGPALNLPRPPDSRLSFAVYEANKLVYDVYTPSPAYLVLSEVYYPGWRATIDGKPVPIYEVNLAFRGVYIEDPGQHVVKLVFRPASVYAGLVISTVTGLGLGMVLLYSWRDRKDSA